MAENAEKKFEYTVEVKELWTQTIRIKSDVQMTVDELRERANTVIEGDDDEDNFSTGDSDYTDTLNQDKWTVRNKVGDYLS